MSDGIYVKVGTTVIDYFDHTTASLLDAAFTKEVDKDGVNVSNAGITVTYIGGQRYSISVSGTAGPPAAAGQYNVTVYVTASPNDRWTAIYRVTNDGTPAGTTGSASFTATASDGRVTDGASPLAGATVYINRPSGGGLYAALTSDASGLWGPVYFDGNGTWPITVQRSGYTIAGGNITVSGATATGPGTDLALSAAASTGYTLSSQLAYARRMYRDRTGNKTDTELTQAVNDAALLLCSEHAWPWYHTVGRINIVATYSTGTVTLTNGSATVTLAGGTFPTWAASGDLYINGMPHSIATRVGDTEITLDNAWAEATVSTSFDLAQTNYDLPADCMKLDKITSTTDWVWGPDPVSRYTLEEARSRWRTSASQPARIWAIIRNQVCIWPMPSEAKMVNILYYRRPAVLVSALDEVDWDPNLPSLLRRAIDYQVSLRGDCVAGSKEDTYKVLREDLSRAVAQDRTSPSRRLGLQSDYGVADRILGATIL